MTPGTMPSVCYAGGAARHARGQGTATLRQTAAIAGFVMGRSSEITGGSGARAEGRETARRFAEHSVVRLKRPVDVKGRSLPSGTNGTVVAAWRDGNGYEVEFFEPFHAVVTLEADDLSA